jgi:Ser/Thr protein kinase RdoA (MazF antagonist)
MKVFSLIGEELARIHQIKLPRAGFIGPEMKIGNQFGSFGLFLKEYIAGVLTSLAEDRLASKVRDRLLKLVEEKWHLVLAAEPASHLVHCDFNPKNIMVSEDDESVVTGILDWEFCLSGNGYIDLGNFFRFPCDYPDGSQEEFVNGYETGGGKVNQHWKDISLLMDLGNMCSFLERREDYQKTFRTARAVIHGTLDYFGY